ncbi:MAG TPA: hypothetical protein VM734_26160 [Kofleriaceae bacterium]|jgi:hypothetical protein|nr:hypothetical protein [Kofleriaceae bacterium]
MPRSCRLPPTALTLVLAAACAPDLDATSAALAGDPVAACPVAAPGAIAGHEAGFYRCAEETLACGPDGYLLGYGAKYAERFYRQTRPWMTPAGRRWIDATLICLQTTLRDRIDAATSCDDVRAIAYDSHPECYVDHGFCALPWVDWLAVVATVDGLDWLSRDAQRQVIVTAQACLHGGGR